MQKLRKILIVLILISLLLVPYSFMAYLCYLGLCGGSESHAIAVRFTTFYGYFSWVYLLIAIGSLIASYFFNKNHHSKIGMYLLFIPILALLPYLYVSINVELIHRQYEKQRLSYYSPHADDYICSAGKFIRQQGDHFYYFNYDKTYTSGTMSNYQNLDDLKKELNQNSIDISQCKNKRGLALE